MNNNTHEEIVANALKAQENITTLTFKKGVVFHCEKCGMVLQVGTQLGDFLTGIQHIGIMPHHCIDKDEGKLYDRTIKE